MYAVQNGHDGVVQMLLSQSQCDLLAKDNVSSTTNTTPLNCVQIIICLCLLEGTSFQST